MENNSLSHFVTAPSGREPVERQVKEMFDKFELAKNGTPHPKNPNVVKISENQYVLLDNPYNVIINTTYAAKSKEENKPLLDFLGKYIVDALARQELELLEKGLPGKFINTEGELQSAK